MLPSQHGLQLEPIVLPKMKLSPYFFYAAVNHRDYLVNLFLSVQIQLAIGAVAEDLEAAQHFA